MALKRGNTSDRSGRFGPSPRRASGVTPDSRGGPLLAAAGVVGPVAFVASWAILGSMQANYSPVSQAISQLAQIGSPGRWPMTGGFLVYGAATMAFAGGSGSILPSTSRWLIGISGAATLAVAAFPLDASGRSLLHGIAAGVGYLSLAGAPLAFSFAPGKGAGRTTGGFRPISLVNASVASVLAGLTSGAFLLASVIAGTRHGLYQRIGLTVGDAWIVATALGTLEKSLAGRARTTERSG